jgi:hypothetical protein
MRTTLSTAMIAAPALPLMRPAAAPPRIVKGGLLRRLLPRREKPTLFHRCLAVHMIDAGKMSALR